MLTMATRRGLRAVALFEAAKGALALVAGAGAVAWLHGYAQGVHGAGPPPIGLFAGLRHRMLLVDPRWLVADLLAYATLRFLEAYGLWRGEVWAEWLAVGSGGIFLPFELRQLAAHFSWPMLALFGVNLAIVGYLVHGRLSASAPRHAALLAGAGTATGAAAAPKRNGTPRGS